MPALRMGRLHSSSPMPQLPQQLQPRQQSWAELYYQLPVPADLRRVVAAPFLLLPETLRQGIDDLHLLLEQPPAEQ